MREFVHSFLLVNDGHPRMHTPEQMALAEAHSQAMRLDPPIYQDMISKITLEFLPCDNPALVDGKLIETGHIDSCDHIRVTIEYDPEKL